MAKLIIDIDGVVSSIKRPHETYGDVVPLPGAVEKLRKLKEQGHYIILHTARHMRSTNGSLGQINKKVGLTTLDWLDRHGIEYDEILFGKPHGAIYLDDNGSHFTGWHKLPVEGFDENRLNLVIPMAGRGSRFEAEGFQQPKPLIDVLGKPMFKWAVDSFVDLSDSALDIRLIFIVLSEHVKSFDLTNILKGYYPDCEVVELDEVTQGQAETVLAAKPLIDNLNRLMIFNVDTHFRCAGLAPAMEQLNLDGLIVCFDSDDPRYSYALSDEQGYVSKTVEKQPISRDASNGAYYFRRGRDFVWAAEEMISSGLREHKEYYVIPTYNQLIEVGKMVRTVACDENWVMGTPEELKTFLSSYPDVP